MALRQKFRCGSELPYSVGLSGSGSRRPKCGPKSGSELPWSLGVFEAGIFIHAYKIRANPNHSVLMAFLNIWDDGLVLSLDKKKKGNWFTVQHSSKYTSTRFYFILEGGEASFWEQIYGSFLGFFLVAQYCFVQSLILLMFLKICYRNTCHGRSKYIESCLNIMVGMDRVNYWSLPPLHFYDSMCLPTLLN